MSATKDGLQTSRSTLWRGIGLMLLLACSFVFDSSSDAPQHSLWIPLVMAVGAMLALQNVLAVALAVTALAGIHSTIGSPDWIVSRAYPMLALTGACTVTGILVHRFRLRIVATRVAREARRREQRSA